MLQNGVGCTTTVSITGSASIKDGSVDIRLSTASIRFDYQLCQKWCQPPLPQPPLCQPPLPQPPLCQPPLPQPPLCQPPLRQPRRQRPQPPLPHQVGVACAPLSVGSLAEPVISETPLRIVCKRVDTDSPEAGCEVVFWLDTASASLDASANSTDAPNAPAGRITERALKIRFDCAMCSPELLGVYDFSMQFACRKITPFGETSQGKYRLHRQKQPNRFLMI